MMMVRSGDACEAGLEASSGMADGSSGFYFLFEWSNVFTLTLEGETTFSTQLDGCRVLDLVKY